jgi:hypothetical protein
MNDEIEILPQRAQSTQRREFLGLKIRFKKEIF